LFLCYSKAYGPPLGFREIDAADLKGWQGEQDHPGLVDLLSAIERISQSSESAPASKLEFGDVFISYAREDRKYVEKLIAYLKSKDLSVWADNRIDYGEQWWRTITANLRSCLAMVVVMTPEADKSKWVEREILLADDLNKPFFPLLLRGQKFPIFVATQFHDVSDGAMPPSDFIEALKRATTK
jgi:TIR domain